MKFIVSSSALLKQLQQISGVINANTVLPILEDYLFEVEKNKLTVVATDLETVMRVQLEIEAKDSGKVCIPSKILMDSLKNIPDQPLTFNIDKNFGIEITSDNGKYKVMGENPDNFPKEPAADDTTSFTMTSAALVNAINKTLFAVSNDELRPAMTGVYCQLSSQYLTFVATDAHKLVRYRRLDAKADSTTSFILPKKALTLLKAALPTDDVNVSVEYNSTSAFFKFNNINLVCRLIDERYPDYEAVIPLNNPNKLSIDRLTFLGSLSRVAIYANKTTHQVRLKITGSELHISSEDIDFANEAHERLSCQYEGEDLEIGFNARFLIEMLKNLSCEEVSLEMSTPNRAGLLLPQGGDENEDVLMLVMPVMLNSYA